MNRSMNEMMQAAVRHLQNVNFQGYADPDDSTSLQVALRVLADEGDATAASLLAEMRRQTFRDMGTAN